MYHGKINNNRYSDRIVENIKTNDSIYCHKCKKMYFPSKNDVSVKRPEVYYLTCTSCRKNNNKAVLKYKKSNVSNVSYASYVSYESSDIKMST